MITNLRSIASLVLMAYHRLVSPFLPRACRFYPSCSVYAAQAIEKRGLLRGALTGLRRFCRCHPWTAGGYDPVI